MNKTDRAMSSLRDVIGLIPMKDRKSVADDIDYLEKMISNYGRMESNLREVKIWIDRATNEA